MALRGRYSEELLTQEKLKELADAQKAAWAANKRASLLSEKIKAAIERGASVQRGSLYYDAKMEMARSTRRKQA